MEEPDEEMILSSPCAGMQRAGKLTTCAVPWSDSIEEQTATGCSTESFSELSLQLLVVQASVAGVHSNTI